MTTIHHLKGALWAGLLLGAVPVCFGQDFNPTAKTTAPGGATPPETATSGYQTQMSSTAPVDVPASPAAGPAVRADDPGSSRLSRSDRHFIKEASQGGLYEVKTGAYAGQNGQTYEVRRIGRHMVADHGRLGGQLADLAAGKGVRVAKEPTPATQRKIDHLTGATATRFDALYVNTLVTDHRNDIAAFEREARYGADPDLKNFASTALPTLRHHLMMLEEAQAHLK